MIGKTHLAQAIGCEAINQGCVVKYRSFFGLVADFLSEEALAQRDRLLRGYLKPGLLIIDDMDLKQLPKHAGEYLVEFVSAGFFRLERGASTHSGVKRLGRDANPAGDLVDVPQLGWTEQLIDGGGLAAGVACASFSPSRATLVAWCAVARTNAS